MAAFGKEARQRAALSRRSKDVAYWENQLATAKAQNEPEAKIKTIQAKVKTAEDDVSTLSRTLGIK